MMETMLSPSQLGLSLRRARGSPEQRREKKRNHRNYTGNSSRNDSIFSLHPEESHSQQHIRLHLRTSAGQLQKNNNNTNTNTNDFLGGYFNIHHSSPGNPNLSPLLPPNFADDNSFFSLSPPYTLASNFPDSPQTVAGDGHSPRSEVLTMSDQSQTLSWNAATPMTGRGPSELEDIPFSDIQLDSSQESMNPMLFSDPNSASTSLSGNWNMPTVNSNAAVATSQLQGLMLPNEFFQFPNSNVASSGPLDAVSPFFSQDWYDPIYSTGDFPPCDPSNFMEQDIQNRHELTRDSMITNDPWDSQNGQASNYQRNANAGNVAFEMPRGDPYDIHMAREGFLDSGQTNHFLLSSQQPVSPVGDSDSEGWRHPSYPSSTYEASHGSPEAGVSPPANSPSPLQSPAANSDLVLRKPKIEPLSPPRQDSEPHHPHIFSALSGISKHKTPRGRQRGLTAREKKEARDVREAKACWACHISKTKCSPCSPGRPCEQCARLAGKRRFCLFTCFNDTLESLSNILVPKYLTGHFTKANVEQFITENATTWGTQYFKIQMDWGYHRYLTAEVVALALRGNSEMGYHHQTLMQEGSSPALVRKQSPPLGIPLAAMGDMQDTYSRYIQEIVQCDLAEYVPIAYTDQETDFAESLLQVVGKFYSAGNARAHELELLRRALEMHVSAVILERSLVLDPDSLEEVEEYLQQRYPRRSAPRCAQRQIKLAFFLVQERRIMRVLKDWGNLMWATNPSKSKDKEWALAFSVFMILILVMDKTMGAAYYFCEGRIRNRGHAAGPQRAEFEKLVRVTQTDLFERCKEIFHWKFKTRKGGREACNPIRDGIEIFESKSKSIDPDVIMFVRDLRNVVGKFEHQIRSHRSSWMNTDSEYEDAGRLACIFLDDFLAKL